MEIFSGYNIYVKLDNKSSIIAVNSNAFISNFSDWILIESNVPGDRGHHAQGNYFDKSIYTQDGIPRYKLVDGKAVERSEEEIEVDRVPIQASSARAQRDKLLAATDWAVLPDSPLDESSKTSLKTYRQALRDVPQQEGFPNNISWPNMPEITK